MSDDDEITSLESLEIPEMGPRSSISWTGQDGLEGKLGLGGVQYEIADSSDAVSSSASEADEWQGRPDSPELPPEYWQVQRLIKYIKVTKQTTNLDR